MSLTCLVGQSQVDSGRRHECKNHIFAYPEIRERKQSSKGEECFLPYLEDVFRPSSLLQTNTRGLVHTHDFSSSSQSQDLIFVQKGHLLPLLLNITT